MQNQIHEDGKFIPVQVQYNEAMFWELFDSISKYPSILQIFSAYIKLGESRMDSIKVNAPENYEENRNYLNLVMCMHLFRLWNKIMITGNADDYNPSHNHYLKLKVLDEKLNHAKK
jgi:hypothetical protein